MHRRPLFWFTLIVLFLASVYFLLPNLQPEVSFLSQLLVAGFLAIALHEAGHVIGGKLMGMRFGYFVTGPFHIEMGRKGIRMRENRNWGLIGGVALMLPVEGRSEDRLRKDLTVMTISGPFTSLTFGLLVLGLWYSSNMDFFGVCSMFHGVILLATILPLPNGQFQTDGAAFYHLLRRTDAAESKIQSARIISEMYGEKRPFYWSSSLYKACQEKMEKATDVKEVFIEALFVFYIEADRDGIMPAIERQINHFQIEPDKRSAMYYGPFLEWRMLADALCGTLDNQKLSQYVTGVSSLSDGTYSRMQAMEAWSRQDGVKALIYSREAFASYEKLNGFGVLERERTRMLATRIRTSAKTIA